MIVLALECSSPVSSVALLQNQEVIGLETSVERPGQNHELVSRIERVLAQGGKTLADVDLFAAGRGPGSYTGMRLALTAGLSMALPGGTPVHVISSGAVLAAEISAETPEEHIVICGDARRERVWLGVFVRADRGVRLESDFRLAETRALDSCLPPRAVVASADFATLFPLAGPLSGSGSRWIEANRVPQAAWLAREAERRFRAGIPSEPPTPLYLHPPVQIKE